MKNRESWLLLAMDCYLRETFKQSGLELVDVKISVGLPHGGKGKRIGEYWSPEASDDNKGSVFISPTIDDSVEVLGTLVHELVHACVGNAAKHGPKFRSAALSVGLEGKMRSTVAGAKLRGVLEGIIKEVGPYPHSKLNLTMSPIKKQTTRMLKMECDDCGYVARASKTAILDKGATLCPCNARSMSVEFKD